MELIQTLLLMVPLILIFTALGFVIGYIFSDSSMKQDAVQRKFGKFNENGKFEWLSISMKDNNQ